MTFHDVRLSDEVERGATGGPRFRTTILSLNSGFEKRNIEWERTRAEFDIGYGLTKKSTQEAVVAFFYARQGRAHTFRFKDWTDFEIGVDSEDTPQSIGTGDGTTDKFQISRRYTSGAQTFIRPVTKIVSSTPRVFLGGVEQVGGFTIDLITGVLDFIVPPSNTVDVGIICEFDNHVRFNTDALDLRAFRSDSFSIPDLGVIEVRDDLEDLS